MSIGDDLKDIVRELVLLVFDRATSKARERVEAKLAPDHVVRDDIEEAIIELRFEHMGLALAELDRRKQEFPDEWRRLVDRAEADARAKREEG